MKMMTSMLLILVITVTGLVTGCNKEKAMQTVRDAENKAATALIYIGNIAKANNDSFEAHEIPKAVHQPVNQAAQKALDGVNAFIVGIKAAKQAIADGADANGQVNLLRINYSLLIKATADLFSLATTLPPNLADKVGGWFAAAQLLIDTIGGLFADLDSAMREVSSNA